MGPSFLHNTVLVNGVCLPKFLNEHDHPWLRILLEEYTRFIYRPKGELAQYLKGDLPFDAPKLKLALAVRFLTTLTESSVAGGISPKILRAKVFELSAASRGPRESILGEIGKSLMMSGSQVEKHLFADLPEERLITKIPQDISIQELCLRGNLFLAQALLSRASMIRIHISGNSRAVIQHAKYCGLICMIMGHDLSQSADVHISGPYSLFRKTIIYGRAIAELVPLLVWCPRFEIRASCIIGGQTKDIRIYSSDPIFPSIPPKLYDSGLEEKFAKAFRRVTVEWNLIREPEPLQAGETLIFPDFAIQHRSFPEKKWLLEIMGFWTPDYVSSKLERLRKTRLSNFILCIRSDYNCSDSELPKLARIIRFKHSIDPREILKIVEGECRVECPL